MRSEKESWDRIRCECRTLVLRPGKVLYEPAVIKLLGAEPELYQRVLKTRKQVVHLEGVSQP